MGFCEHRVSIFKNDSDIAPRKIRRMIPRYEWYGYLVVLLIVVIRFEGKLDAIREELKALREKIDVK